MAAGIRTSLDATTIIISLRQLFTPLNSKPLPSIIMARGVATEDIFITDFSITNGNFIFRMKNITE